MTTIRLKIPTLVQQIRVDENPQYFLRPAFLSYPVATHRRYETALNTLRKEIKQLFKGYEFNKENSSHILWYLFNPNPVYEQFHLSLNLGNQYVNGLFGAIHFTLKDLTIVALPLMNNFMFILDPEKTIKEAVTEVVDKLLRKYKKEQQEDFVPDVYFSDKREFLTFFSSDVKVKQGAFKHQQSNDHFFFSRIGQNTTFDGEMEIERVGQNLNYLYPSELNRAFYREELVAKLSRILYQSDNTPIAIVGEEGVGKHTLIQEVVYRHIEANKQQDKVPSMWHIDPTRVISGMSYVGMWQKRFEAILAFLMNKTTTHPQDRLLVDNPIALLSIGRSAQNNMTLSDVLKPYLEKRELQLTLLATPEEWKRLQELDRRFSDLFQVIRIYPPDMETATKMVLQQRRLLETENDTIITIHAIYELFSLQRHYFKNQVLPGSVMKLMRQLASKYRFQQVDAPEVREAFETYSGLEKRIFDSGERLEENEVKNHLSRELIGQPDAIAALTGVVHLIKARLTRKQKPLASFLFMGPTGVGKTQAAKVLAKYLMGDEKQLLRYDMNEYLDEYAVHRLIGDEFNPEGQLTGRVRYHPFSIILLDEIEKAHPKVHNLLLQVLDDGRLTDSLGRTTYFSNSIIIMTSNIGAEAIDRQVGFTTSEEEQAKIYQKEVEKFFRPELINRIDELVVFKSLELDHILRIARLQIKELLQRDGFVRRTTILNISKDALEWVARRGFDQKMGGRALRRQIEKDLTTLSADQLIATNTASPIIFNIFFRDGQLKPSIQHLNFIESIEERDYLPDLPPESKIRSFYGRLLKSVQRMQSAIEKYEDNGEANQEMISLQPEEIDWQHYHFKNKVSEIKENLENALLSHSERRAIRPPSIPIRLKRGHLNRRTIHSSKVLRENFRDQLFQKEALREIRDAYQFGQEQFDQDNADLVNSYLKVAFLQLEIQGFLENTVDECEIQFSSLITGMGNWEIGFLMDKYEELLKALDMPHQLDRKRQRIQLEGHRIYNLLQGEQGVHLFYAAHQSPLPIRLELRRIGGDNILNKAMSVIRIYDGDRTLTDLRTGFSNAANLNVNEFQLLLFAGIRKDLRKQVIREI